MAWMGSNNKQFELTIMFVVLALVTNGATLTVGTLGHRVIELDPGHIGTSLLALALAGASSTTSPCPYP